MSKILVFVFIFCVFPLTSHALVAPEIQWKTLVTDHFEIIFESEQQSLAEDFGRAAERAHLLLSPVFTPPSQRTIVWLNDHTDSPNGMATVFPRNTIILYPVLPGSLDSISHYDNWSQKLVAHEYTHILNMEPAEGIWSPFRFLFGNIIRPNALLPTWYLEGLAVEAETQFTKYGRLRSPYFNALIRAMVKDNTWFSEPLAWANETHIPSWPQGLRPYFWGSLMMHEIAQRKGFASLGDLNTRYAGRVPFFINGPTEDLLGVDYEDLFLNLKTNYEKRARDQITWIKNHNRQEKNLNTLRLTPLGGDIHSPVISPNQLKLAFIRINDNRDSEVHIAERASLQQSFDFTTTRIVYSGTDVSRVSFWPDSQSIVFDSINTDRLYNSYSDIYRLYLNDRHRDALTQEARVREAAVDQDGHRLTFVKVSAAQTELGVLTRGNVINSVYAPPRFHRVSHPSFLNAYEIIFSERDPQGREYLKVFNLQTKDVRTVLPEYNSAQNPIVSNKGVLFVSYKSGVSNLYWSSLSLYSARPVTNSTTAISTGVLDSARDELIFTQLTGKGYQLHTQTLPIDNYKLPQAQPLIKDPEYKWQEPEVRTAMEVEEYSPMSYLLPQYWLPLFGFIEGGIAVSAMTSAQDPLHKHAYALEGNYDTLTKKLGGSGRYDLAMGDGTLTAMGGQDHIYYYAYDLTSSNTRAEIQYSVFPTRDSKFWNLGARMSQLSTDIPGARLYNYAGPAAFVSYSDSSQKPTEISPMSGIEALLDYQYFLGPWGNVDFSRTRFSFSGYHSKWLPQRNALALDLNAYVSPKNRSVFLGTTAGGDYSLTFLSSKSFIVRGYPVGEFLGWKMASGSLEYRLPLSDSPSDFSTFPASLRRWHGAIFADAIALEGYYYAKDIKGARTTDMGNLFYGVGVEARSDITLGYHMPAMLRLGLYMGLNENAYGGIGPFVALSVPQF